MTVPDLPRARVWAVAALVLIVALALGRLWWLPAYAPLNINEGWNAGHVARAFGAGSLYPAPDALIANNYPPLSFFIVGVASRIFGDTIITGRTLSLFAEIAVGGAVYVLVARLSGSSRWAAAGALLFGLFAVTLLRNYLVMNDPQWLAQATMAWALVLLVRRSADEPLAIGTVVAAAALTVAGGLIKHNLVALPIAGTLWLLLTQPRAFAIWVVSGAAFAAVACAALFAVWGDAVFIDVLGPARSYSPVRMAAHGAPLVLFVLPGLIAARPLLAAMRGNRQALLPVLLLAVAIPTAILQRSGDGVDINATFETIFALSIAVPAGCALRRDVPWRWLGLAALPALALVPVAAMADVRELAGRNAAIRHWKPFIDAVAATRGPVACDDQALCYWAGRESALDFFAIKQRLLKGDVPAFRTALDRGDFALIAMRSENPGWHENRLIPAVRARYRTVYAEGGFELLVPR